MQFMKGLMARGVLVCGFLLGIAANASAQSALINGVNIYEGFAGDTLYVDYTFAGNDSVADVTVWIDFNKNGVIDTSDFPVFMTKTDEERLIDGGMTDEDSTRNGTYSTMIPDFIPLAPAQFIFEFVQSSGVGTTAILIQEHAPSNFVLRGIIDNPDSTANLFVSAFGFADDSSGNGEGGGLAAGGKGKKGYLPLLSRAQVFGRRTVAEIDSADSAANDSCDYRSEGPIGDRDEEMGVFLATLTNENGVFEIPLPDTGPSFWEVEAADAYDRAPGWFPPATEFVTKQSLPDTLHFTFLPTTATISGTVTDRNGDPLELIVIAYNQQLGVGVETLSIGGEYELDVIGGEYWVEISDPNNIVMESESQFLSVNDGDNAVVDFQLYRRDAMITGRVSIGDSLGLGCVMVFAENDAGMTAYAVTDADGRYMMEVSSAANPWRVSMDFFAIPEGMRIDGDETKIVDAPADLVDFVLIEGDSLPVPDDEFDDQSVEILSVRDIPDDQGLQVRVIWRGAPGDYTTENPEGDRYVIPVTGYGVWRRGPEIPMRDDSTGAGGGMSGSAVRVVGSEAELLAAAQTAKPGDRFKVSGQGAYVWDFLARVPAAQLEGYAYVAPTLRDSTAEQPAWAWFVISTHTVEPSMTFFSMPDSGYSVDNLAPVIGTIASRVTDNGVELTWETPDTPDLVAVSVYRSESSGFTPGAANFVTAVDAGGYFDAGGTAGSYYVLKLTDDGGNVTWSPEFRAGTITSVRDNSETLPEAYRLSQNFPNPFNPSTRIEFALPQADNVRIEIFNVMGQKVRTLYSGALAAGYHAVTWQGLDDRGARVPSGTYIYKLSTGTTTIAKKMLLAK